MWHLSKQNQQAVEADEWSRTNAVLNRNCLMTCLVVPLFLVVVVSSAFWTLWHAYNVGEVPEFPSEETGLQAQRIVHHFSLPGWQSGVYLATFQLEDFDAEAWIRRANALPKYGARTDEVWVRGPISGAQFEDAFEFAINPHAVGWTVWRYQWRKWIKSENCFFMFWGMDGETMPTGRWYYKQAHIWVLDVQSKRMYLIDRIL